MTVDLAVFCHTTIGTSTIIYDTGSCSLLPYHHSDLHHYTWHCILQSSAIPPYGPLPLYMTLDPSVFCHTTIWTSTIIYDTGSCSLLPYHHSDLHHYTWHCILQSSAIPPYGPLPLYMTLDLAVFCHTIIVTSTIIHDTVSCSLLPYHHMVLYHYTWRWIFQSSAIPS